MDVWGERRGDWVNVCGERRNLSQRLEREKGRMGQRLWKEGKSKSTFGERGEISVNVWGKKEVFW